MSKGVYDFAFDFWEVFTNNASINRMGVPVRRRGFELLLRVDGTDFQMAVWDALLKIPFGKTVSYKRKEGTPDNSGDTFLFFRNRLVVASTTRQR